MSIPVNSKVQARFFVQTPKSICMLNLWFKITATGTAPDDTTDLTNLRDMLADFTVLGTVGYRYKNLLPSNCTIYQIDTQVVWSYRSAYVRGSYAQVGTYGAVASTDNLAATLTLRTNHAGRNQIANKHIGPLPDGSYSNGVLIAGYITLLSQLGTALLVTQVTSTGLACQPIVNHPAAGSDPALTTSSSARVGTMARRTVLRGI